MFYTYLWLREDGTPYYVGKGKEKRAFRHGCPMIDVIPGWIDKPDEERIVLQYFESEEEAFFAEKVLIAVYGRIDNGTGCLINLTEGGEGTSGHRHTEETREKLRQAGKLNSRFLDQNGTKNHMFGKTISAEQKEAIRVAAKHNKYCLGSKHHITPHTEETKRTLSNKTKKLWEDPAYRQHMSDIHKKKV